MFDQPDYRDLTDRMVVGVRVGVVGVGGGGAGRERHKH